MKKNNGLAMRIFALALVMLMLVGGGALAEKYVVDEVGLLTSEEVAQLAALAERISGEYGIDMAVHAHESLGGLDVYDHAEAVWKEAGYSEDAMLLVMVMDTRDLTFFPIGAAMDVFTDSIQDGIRDIVAARLSAGNYYEGFDMFLNLSETHLKYAARSPMERAMGMIYIPLIGAVLIALIGMSILKKGMRTAVAQRDARQYMRPGSMKMHRSSDLFLYRTVVRRKRPTQSSSGGGGTTKGTTSSGKTHGGSTGKF